MCENQLWGNYSDSEPYKRWLERVYLNIERTVKLVETKWKAETLRGSRLILM